MSRTIGWVLLVLGLIGLAWGGIGYTKKHDVDLGPVDLTVNEHKTVPIPPIAGAAAVLAGLALVVAGRNRGTT